LLITSPTFYARYDLLLLKNAEKLVPTTWTCWHSSQYSDTLRVHTNGARCLAEAGILLSPGSGPTLGSTLSRILWVPKATSREVKQPERETDHPICRHVGVLQHSESFHILIFINEQGV
jgi:hypothetical protein